MIKKYVFCPTWALMIFTTHAVAGMMAETTPAKEFSMPLGRVQASVAGVTGSLGVFSGDAMVPVYGNSEGFLYGNIMGDYGTDATYLVSPGLGFRQICDNQIFGAYFFGDYEKTSLGKNFWNLSPGIEWMNAHWDAHVNGYFPTETQEQNGTTVFLNTLGDSSQVSFETGTHNQYDELVTPYAVIGNGVDVEVGYSFVAENNLRSRVYLGGYYYQPPADADVDNIPGVTAGFEQPITKDLKISIFNSYDQVSEYHAGVSLTLTLGGESNLFSNDVHTRLLDPVERHVGIIDTAAGTYDQQSLKNEGTNLEYDNVYFVSYNGTEDATGTYGDPMLLEQTALDTINTNNPDSSRIYIQGGTDAIYYINASTGSTEDLNSTSTSGLFVYSGQDFYGRTSDYTAPATANEKPQIAVDAQAGYSGFILVESGENTFSDLDIFAQTLGDTKGILVYNDTSEDEVLNINNTSISNFLVGVGVTNDSGQDVTINTNNSQFNDNTGEGDSVSVYGMRVYNNDSGNLTVNANHSQFNYNTATGINSSAVGLYCTNNGTGIVSVNASSSQFNGNTASGSDVAYALGLEVDNYHGGDVIVNATHSQFNDNSVTGDGRPTSTGLQAYNESEGNITLNIRYSQFNNNIASGTGAYAFGINEVNGNSSSGNYVTRIENSEFNNNAVTNGGIYASGIYSYNGYLGNMIIGAINSEFSGNSGDGFYVSNNSTVGGDVSVKTLEGSSFDNNGEYGLYATAAAPGHTTVNYFGTSFYNNGIMDIGTGGNVNGALNLGSDKL